MVSYGGGDEQEECGELCTFFGLTMDQPPEPGGFLIDNQEISFGTTKLKAIHVPGHTAGSLAFYSQDEKVVFTGDALFAGSIGRTDLPGGDYATLIKSITGRLFLSLLKRWSGRVMETRQL